MSDPSTPGVKPLQFDRAVRADAPRASTPSVKCSKCGGMIGNSYYTLGGRPFCETCKRRVDEGGAASRGSGAFGKAFVYGVGAAIAGAVVYYAVIALLNLEIGIVAILIGYMVGTAIRKALNGAGGRRYQILAAVLTYWAVGLAYVPLALGLTGDKPAKTASSAKSARSNADNADAKADSVAADDSAAVGGLPAKTVGSPASAKPGGVSFIKVVGFFLFFSFALPVIVVLGSLPSGAISALIIGFGVRRAWRMTEGSDLEFVGPLRVGSGAASAPA